MVKWPVPRKRQPIRADVDWPLSLGMHNLRMAERETLKSPPARREEHCSSTRARTEIDNVSLPYAFRTSKKSLKWLREELGRVKHSLRRVRHTGRTIEFFHKQESRYMLKHKTFSVAADPAARWEIAKAFKEAWADAYDGDLLLVEPDYQELCAAEKRARRLFIVYLRKLRRQAKRNEQTVPNSPESLLIHFEEDCFLYLFWSCSCYLILIAEMRLRLDSIRGFMEVDRSEAVPSRQVEADRNTTQSRKIGTLTDSRGAKECREQGFTTSSASRSYSSAECEIYHDCRMVYEGFYGLAGYPDPIDYYKAFISGGAGKERLLVPIKSGCIRPYTPEEAEAWVNSQL